MTTQLRFHPFEAVITLGGFAIMAGALAPPPIAILLVEVMRALSGFAVHANARFPEALERRINRLLVTPDLHRIHHSIDRTDHDTNFGIVFSFWDRLLGTLRIRGGPVTAGIAEVSPLESAHPVRVLLSPFHTARPIKDRVEAAPK
jgi:sterol desaturase/sphingolipid hydroxylase (fatty acid hydroxylase superfamily)